jgi:hypothetical protein
MNFLIFMVVFYGGWGALKLTPKPNRRNRHRAKQSSVR